jgi:uncharacterized protein DUF6941
MSISAEQQFKVTMMLADAAQVVDGKLYILGGGWTSISPGLAQFAIAGIVDVPWAQTNEQHAFRLDCIDLDGNPLMAPTTNGEMPLAGEGTLGVGRPLGVRPGAAIPVALALPFNVVLPPGGAYEWRLSIGGETREEWRMPFRTSGEAPAGPAS